MITDLAMPHLSGVELCRRIRMISRVPIIVLSVRTEHRAKAEALDSGADDYVTKPFGIEELLARVRAGPFDGTSTEQPSYLRVYMAQLRKKLEPARRIRAI